MPYSDELDQESVSGILGDITDIDGLLDLDFITDVEAPTTEGGASMASENPHAYQVGLGKIGNLAKKGLTWGATAGLYGINPLLAVAAHTPPSVVKLGAKKFGQKFLGLPEDTPWGQLDQAGKVALAQERFGLMEDFYGPTPLSKFVNRFVDIVFPGGTTLDED